MPSSPEHARRGPAHMKYFDHKMRNMLQEDITKLLIDIAQNMNSETFSINDVKIPLPESGLSFAIKFEKHPKHHALKFGIEWSNSEPEPYVKSIDISS